MHSPSPNPPPQPLTGAELAQLHGVASTLTFGLEFAHCHESESLGRWGGRVNGRERPPSEEELLQLESIQPQDPMIFAVLAERYLKLTYSIRRDLLIQLINVEKRSPTEVRELLALRERVEPKMLKYLDLAGRAGRDRWRFYRYELALQQLTLGDFANARDTAGSLLSKPGASDFDKRPALLLAMSHLAKPATVDDLHEARRVLARVASGNDSSLPAVIAGCFHAEVLTRLGQRAKATAQWRALRNAHHVPGVWRVATQRLRELGEAPPDPVREHGAD